MSFHVILFVLLILFLALLALVSLGGVIAGGRFLIQPLKKLAAAALQVHSGNFDLERLPDSGPREVVTTTEAFNDMTSTLKAVEAALKKAIEKGRSGRAAA